MMNNNPPLNPCLRPFNGMRQLPPLSHSSQGGILTPMTFIGKCFRCTSTIMIYVMRPIWLHYMWHTNPHAIPHVSVELRFSTLPGTSVLSVLPAINMLRERCKVWTLNSRLYIGSFQRLLLPRAVHILFNDDPTTE
jgi:hypothetical protein